MKNILLCLGLLLNLHSYSQPVPDYLLPYDDTLNYSDKVSFTDYGDKFFYTGGSDSLRIVLKNYDGSIFKTFTPIAGLSYVGFTHANTSELSTHSISDKLFDDDSTIEFLAVKYIPSLIGACLLYVVNEFGNIEYTFPDTIVPQSYANNHIAAFIFKFSDSYKMGYEIYRSQDWRTFTLPGSLPCDQCGIFNGIEVPGNGNGEFAGLKAYPNPFNQTLSIEYNFSKPQNGELVLTGVDGKELRSITLNNQSDKLTLSTADLPKGMIIANLYGKSGNLISKKLVKIE